MASRGDVLISGASVAGPTLAFWLQRFGWRPIVVERSPALRRGWGGHAVDLFGPAVDIAEQMGILPDILQARTRTELISLVRPGKRPVDIDFTRLVAGIADHHVEVEVPRASRTGDPLGSFSEKVRARASESTEVLPGVQR